MNMKKSKIKIISLLVTASLLLGGCSASEINDLLGIGGTPEEGTTEQVSAPEVQVISIVDDTAAVITPADENGEAVDEEPAVQEKIYDPVEKKYSVETADPGEITLAFVGDVGFAEGYATINRYRSMGSDINKSLDAQVLEVMQGVDIMMANNEFPYSYRGSPTPNKTYTFRADPKDVHIMKDMGVDIVSLANNHAYDYGPDALIDTVDTLNEAMLPFVGAGKNIEEAKKPVYFYANGHVISYLSATQIERYGNPDTREATEDSPGVMRTLDPAKFVATIEEAAQNSDFTVVYVHWGSESTDLVEKSQRDLAKAYVDAGADLIIGDHSHCLQGIDFVDGVPVFYSLGNFWFNSKTLDTCIVRATLDGECKLSKLEFIPCSQTGSCVRCVDSGNYDRILEYMRGISDYAQIDSNGIVTESDTNHNTQNGQNTSPAKKPAKEETAPTPEEAAAAALQDMMNAMLEQQTGAVEDAGAATE